jgi:hypothetical protein
LKTNGRNCHREAIVRWAWGIVIWAFFTAILFVGAPLLRPTYIQKEYECRILKVDNTSIVVATAFEIFTLKNITNIEMHRLYFKDLVERKALISLKIWEFEVPERTIEIMLVSEFFDISSLGDCRGSFFPKKRCQLEGETGILITKNNRLNKGYFYHLQLWDDV